MTERRRKVHMMEDTDDTYALCGAAPDREHLTYTADRITCRVCMFHYLAGCTTWARDFLNNLRGVVNIPRVRPPAWAAKQVDRPVEGSSGRLGRSFSFQGRPQKVVSEFLSVPPAQGSVVQPVVNDGGPAALPVGVKEGEIAENPRNAGQIGSKTRGRL